MDPRSAIAHPRQPVPDPGPRSVPPAPRGRRFGVAALIALVVIGTGAVVRAPVHSVGPGPARDVLDLIKIEGASTFPSSGKMLLTTASVSSSPLTLWELLYVWIDPSLATTPRRTVVQPGLDDQDQTDRNFLDMEQSKLLAELAAFDALGLTAARIRGARILRVRDGGPAQGALEDGDLIVSIDGRDVAGPDDVGRLIGRVRVGETVEFQVQRGGEQRAVRVETVASPDDPDAPIVGIFVGEAWRLPHDVQIDTQQIGGPSGGLVFALSLVDVLTPEDLTRGHVIAATGTIERGEDGSALIGRIGAVPEKVRAAEAVGATVFMLPASEADEAERLAPDGMIVIGVSTLEEAIAALRRIPERTTG